VGVFWCLLTVPTSPTLPADDHPPWRILSWIALFCLLTVAAEAQAQNDAAAASPAPVSWEQNAISRIQDLFELDLPKTERPGRSNSAFSPIFAIFSTKAICASRSSCAGGE